MDKRKYEYSHFLLFVAFSIIASIPIACVDADPFGFNKKTIVGKYCLERFDTKSFYINKDGTDLSGCGYIGGATTYLFWNEEYVVANRSHCAGPSGWMVIDLKSDSLSGPFETEVINARFPNNKPISAQEAWKKL